MKAKQMLGIFSIGLFTAILLYPTLHEAGHSLLALIVGAKVVDFNLFPIPSIMCDVFGVGNTGIILIGLGGIIIPYVISMIFKTKNILAMVFKRFSKRNQFISRGNIFCQYCVMDEWYYCTKRRYYPSFESL